MERVGKCIQIKIRSQQRRKRERAELVAKAPTPNSRAVERKAAENQLASARKTAAPTCETRTEPLHSAEIHESLESNQQKRPRRRSEDLQTTNNLPQAERLQSKHQTVRRWATSAMLYKRRRDNEDADTERQQYGTRNLRSSGRIIHDYKRNMHTCIGSNWPASGKQKTTSKRQHKETTESRSQEFNPWNTDGTQRTRYQRGEAYRRGDTRTQR